MRPIELVLAGLMCGLLGGCSGDPETSRLSTGQEVIATGTDGSEVVYLHSDHANGDDGSGVGKVELGSKVRVVKDDEKDYGEPQRRQVTVLVLEGQQKDISGTIDRLYLRPATSR